MAPSMSHSPYPLENCGTHTYTLQPPETDLVHNFLTVDTATGEVSVTSIGQYDAGTYVINLEIALISYPTVTTQNSFIVTIEDCIPSTITPPLVVIEPILHVIGTLP